MALPISWKSGVLPPVIGSSVTIGTDGIVGPNADTIRFAQVSGQAAHVRWDFVEGDSEPNLAIRTYIKTPSSWPSASFNVVSFNNDAHGMIAMISLSGSGSPGQFRLLRTGGSTVSSSPSNLVAVNTWYRMELQISANTQQARAAIFSVDGSQPLWASAWMTHVDYSVPVRRVLVGAINTTPMAAPFLADGILVDHLPDANAWLGKASAEPTGLQWRLNELVSAIGKDIKELRDESKQGKLVNPLGLSMWQTSLSNHTIAKAKMVVIGDSNAEGAGTGYFNSTWPSRVQALLRARKGISGGVGYIASAPTDGAFVVQPPVTRAATVPAMGSWGLGGRATQISAAEASIAYEPQVCDRIRVWYGKTSVFGGTMDVWIDGVKVDTVNSYSTTDADGFFWDSGLLTRGSHTIWFSSPAGWIGILDAVEFFDGDFSSGVTVYNGGHYGYSSQTFNPVDTPSMQLHWQSVTAINPTLTIISLGSNDLLGPQTVANYAANLSSIINATPSTSSILLLMPIARGDARGVAEVLRWNQMREAAENLAVGRVSFLDLEHWFPSMTANTETWGGLMSDSVHFNTAGFETLAEVVVEHIATPIRR